MGFFKRHDELDDADDGTDSHGLDADDTTLDDADVDDLDADDGDDGSVG